MNDSKPKGINNRAVANLAADLGVTPQRLLEHVRRGAEAIPLTSIGPSGLGGDYQVDAAGKPQPTAEESLEMAKAAHLLKAMKLGYKLGRGDL